MNVQTIVVKKGANKDISFHAEITGKWLTLDIHYISQILLTDIQFRQFTWKYISIQTSLLDFWIARNMLLIPVNCKYPVRLCQQVKNPYIIVEALYNWVIHFVRCERNVYREIPSINIIQYIPPDEQWDQESDALPFGEYIEMNDQIYAVVQFKCKERSYGLMSEKGDLVLMDKESVVKSCKRFECCYVPEFGYKQVLMEK